LPYSVEIFHLPEGSAKLPFPVKTGVLRHTSLTLGYRIKIEGKVISYCPDTGYCKNAVIVSRSSDLLIAECAYKAGQSSDSWPHLNPESAAKIAVEAGSKRLALVHFDADVYKTITERSESEKEAQKIFKNTFATADGMQIEI